MCRIDVIVNLPPIAEAHPDQHGPAEQQSSNGGSEKKDVVELQPDARDVGELERQRDENGVRDPKENSDLMTMAPEHSNLEYIGRQGPGAGARVRVSPFAPH